MVRKSSTLRIVLLCGDIAALVGSVVAAYWIRFNTGLFATKPLQSFELYYNFSMLIAFVGTIMLYLGNHYRSKGVLFSIDIFFSLLRIVTLTFLTALIINFLMKGYLTTSEVETQSRIILIVAWILAILSLSSWRGILNILLKKFRQRGIGLNQVLIVGADQSGKRFYDALQSKPDLGYNAIGFLENGSLATVGIERDMILGEVEDLEKLIKSRWIDQIVVTANHLQPETVAKLMVICERADIQFTMVPSFLEILTFQSQIYDVAGIPVVTMEERVFQRRNRTLKRALDLFLSSVLFLFTSPFLVPLIAIVMIAIKLESPGPVFFRQQRVGKGGRPIWLFKFRSMCDDAEFRKEELMHLNEAEGALFKMREDPRVTRVGRIIRRYSIDELPQLINVFKGEMSLVGPRPPVPQEVEQYEDWQTKRFDLLPGMVGLPQVSGRSDLTFEEVIRLDLYYIENWSLLLDLKILLKAVPVVFLGKGAY